MEWSISQDRVWSRCQRQYFFQYLMASSRANDKQRRKAQFLKDLLTPELWQGKLVHRIIETVILPSIADRPSKWPRPEAVIPHAIALAKKQFAFSLGKSYEDPAFEKKEAEDSYCVLEAHYHGIYEDRDLLDETISKISDALRNLLSSERMKAFLMGRPLYRFEKSHYFKVTDTTVKAIPDLVLVNKNRSGIDVIDWKLTHTSDPYDLQIAVYALAVKHTDWLFRQAPGELHGYVINLLEADPAISLIDPYRVDESVLDRTMDIIYEKIEPVEALLKGRKYEQLSIHDFKGPKSHGTCGLCKWKSMCVEMIHGTPAKLLPSHEPKLTQRKLPFA